MPSAFKFCYINVSYPVLTTHYIPLLTFLGTIVIWSPCRIKWRQRSHRCTRMTGSLSNCHEVRGSPAPCNMLASLCILLSGCRSRVAHDQVMVEILRAGDQSTPLSPSQTRAGAKSTTYQKRNEFGKHHSCCCLQMQTRMMGHIAIVHPIFFPHH